MLSFILMQYIALPERSDAILINAVKNGDKINVYSSGSIGLYYNGMCHQTHPNDTLSTSENEDWCSNIIQRENRQQILPETEKPWILFHIENKAMHLRGYSIRNGCCRRICCCTDDSMFIDNVRCCCYLYSFTILGSNDNKTWVSLHSVEKDREFRICEAKTYEINDRKQSFKFIKFRMDEEYPGCPFCVQINQFEFYGETTNSIDDFAFDENDDESVSIIGKVKTLD